MKLQAVCTGRARPIAAKSGQTGHFKTPCPGARIDVAGVSGDTIVDRKHHGGPDQAIYLLGEADRQWWEAELGHPVPAGYMGENLLIDGLSSGDLAFGDRLAIGEVLLEITAPRVPCVTFNARIGRTDGIRTFFASGHPGAYARVLRGGEVMPWDQVDPMPWLGDRLGIVAHLDHVANGLTDRAYLARCLTVPAHAALHRIARQRLDAGSHDPI